MLRRGGGEIVSISSAADCGPSAAGAPTSLPSITCKGSARSRRSTTPSMASTSTPWLPGRSWPTTSGAQARTLWRRRQTRCPSGAAAPQEVAAAVWLCSDQAGPHHRNESHDRRRQARRNATLAGSARASMSTTSAPVTWCRRA